MAYKDLDQELARRKVCPPILLPGDRWQQTSVENLEREFRNMPANHPDREWHEYELALARRQRELDPEAPFMRVITFYTVEEIERCQKN